MKGRRRGPGTECCVNSYKEKEKAQEKESDGRLEAWFCGG